jgi:Rhs element Vgr protein
MSVIAKIELKIGGQIMRDILSVRLYQSIHTAHSFEVSCRFDAVEGEEGKFPDKSSKIPGKKCDIEIDNKKIFSGIATETEAYVSSSPGQKYIVIRGKSPEIVLDNLEDCRSFENESLKAIIKEITNPYDNFFDLKIDPIDKSTKHPYIVQYNETPYSFISRLCSKYGEWFFYNGDDLYIGEPRKKVHELEYGTELHSFSAKNTIFPNKFQLLGYDYVEGKATDLISSESDDSQNQLSKFGKETYDISSKVFKPSNMNYYNQPLQVMDGNNHIKKAVQLRKSGLIGNIVTYTGITDNPKIKVGDLIEIKKLEHLDVDDKFLVIEVNHHCELNGNYENEFTAIDAGITRPPETNPLQVPVCETQPGIVTDNKDPEKLNRVRVQFPWQKRHNEETPWIRVAYPHGGAGKGICFVPEIDEEVLVAFEGDNAEKPYVVGSVFNGKAKPDKELYSDKNDSKVIRTRSGNTIEFYDKKGKEEIRIYDKDTKNAITFSSHDKKLTIWSEDEIHIEAQKITINAKKELNLNGDDKLVASTNNQMTHKSKSKIEMDGKSIDVKGGTKLQMKAAQIKMN